MSGIHTAIEEAKRRASTLAPCWFCGFAALGGVCAEDERAACFARSVRPPPGPAAHPPGRGACAEDEPCEECARAYSEPDARDIEEDEAT